MCPCKLLLLTHTQSEFQDDVSFLGQYILEHHL